MDFSYIIHCGIISAALLAGAFLRSRVKLFQRYLIPSSIIGGALLLLFYNFAAPRFGMNSDFLGDLVYHLLNISFIAMMLRRPEDTGGRRSRRTLAENVTAVIGQYGLQCFLALLLVWVLMSTVMPDLFPAIALTLPLGFELGPGQAYSMALPWEAMGFEGGTSVGLAMAAIGFLVGSVGGVILINIGIKRGWVSKDAAEKLRNRDTLRGFIPEEKQESGCRNTTQGESIDSFSYHFALILATYLVSWAGLSAIDRLLTAFAGNLGAELASSLWGVNFIFSVFAAQLVRFIMEKAKIDYTIDRGTMNRINGLSVDLTVISSLGAISLAAVSQYWLPILLLSLLGVLITCVMLPWYCSRLYSDLSFQRMLLIFGTATGTLPTGLSLLRVVDPEFETPVATDYVYASGVIFILAIPIILCANLPAMSYAQNNPALYWVMALVTGLYTLAFAIAYKILAGKKAFADGRTLFYR